MTVRTIWNFTQPPETVWPLLCNSRMQPTRSCLFGLGLPRPEQCRLPDGPGGVGGRRQCVSDRGVIEQTILHWQEPTRLAFRMDKTDLYLKNWVTGIVDDFELTAISDGGTRATRTTTIDVAGPFRRTRQVLLWIGLKKIHRFVFANWQRLAEAPARASVTA